MPFCYSFHNGVPEMNHNWKILPVDCTDAAACIIMNTKEKIQSGNFPAANGGNADPSEINGNVFC